MPKPPTTPMPPPSNIPFQFHHPYHNHHTTLVLPSSSSITPIQLHQTTKQCYQHATLSAINREIISNYKAQTVGQTEI
ncbi:hypothetical protein Ahy_B03g066007 isoform D [Arachis hypogaea]|uniref:Uncharacterized protein n=1 Tax=Arachis hypogaea TaxID=3818 RepID=A0A445A2V9_ARAHY|nr:hypothetical protein Ahy_B03g066007 isoform D [Arachis hypogaea]